MWVSIINIR